MQFDLSIICSWTYTTVSTDSVHGQQRPRSACTFVQADQGLHCPHSADLFMHWASFGVIQTFDASGGFCESSVIVGIPMFIYYFLILAGGQHNPGRFGRINALLILAGG